MNCTTSIIFRVLGTMRRYWFSNGALRVDVDDTSIMNDDHIWSLNFAGTFANGAVNLNAISNAQVVHGDNDASAVTAVLGGVFAGAEAEHFLGGFDLLDATNNNSVQGLYTLDKTPLNVPQ